MSSCSTSWMICAISQFRRNDFIHVYRTHLLGENECKRVTAGCSYLNLWLINNAFRFWRYFYSIVIWSFVCLFFYLWIAKNSIVCLIILAFARLLTRSRIYFFVAMTATNPNESNRTSLCLHWLNFLLCVDCNKTKKATDLFPVRTFLMKLSIILILPLEQQQKNGQKSLKYWTFLLFHWKNAIVRSSHVFPWRACMCGFVFHWHINMFDLRFCFLERKKSKENNINLRTNWLTGKVFSLYFIVAKQIRNRKRREMALQREKSVT